MQFDFSRLTEGDIAVLTGMATIAAAMIAAVSAFVTGVLKNDADAKGAAAAAHRGFLTNRLDPFLRYVDLRVDDAMRINTLWNKYNLGGQRGELTGAMEEFVTKREKVSAIHYSLLNRRAFAYYAVQEWDAADKAFTAFCKNFIDGDKASISTKDIDTLGPNLVDASRLVFEAIQRLIFREKLGKPFPVERHERFLARLS